MRRSERGYQRLITELGDVRRMLILTHDNPDPDAIAAGWVLGYILRGALNLRTTLAYEGVVGRAENRAMVELLRIPLVPLSDVVLDRHDAVALVDTQPGTGNNSLPDAILPRVVFDHHPLRRKTRDVPFVDLRVDYGATATILTEYLEVSDLPIRPRHATGLFYAIRSETQNLGRESSIPDSRAFLALFPKADSRLISHIEQAPISRRYLALLNGAFRATRLHGELSLTKLGAMPYPDVVAELADLLLRVDQVRWALVMGRYRGSLYVSLRTENPRGNAAREIAAIIGDLGKAGGHGSMAGGRIDLRGKHRDPDRIERTLAARARERLGDGRRGRPLLTGRETEAGTTRDGARRRPKTATPPTGREKDDPR